MDLIAIACFENALTFLKLLIRRKKEKKRKRSISHEPAIIILTIDSNGNRPCEKNKDETIRIKSLKLSNNTK